MSECNIIAIQDLASSQRKIDAPDFVLSECNCCVLAGS